MEVSKKSKNSMSSASNENKVNEKSSLIEKIKKKIKDWRVLTELQNIIRTS